MSKTAKEQLTEELADAEKRIYLGDSVYAWHDGYHTWLATNNGVGDSNSIALEPDVWKELKRFVERIESLHSELSGERD